MLYPRAQCYLQTWHRHWARGSQVRLLYVCGISRTKSVHSYSDTSTSHHTYCMCMNHLCIAHVVNLADPGVARFLASQMKLLCRCSPKSGRPANATISLVPQILPSWNFQKITTIYSWQSDLWEPCFQEHFQFYSLLFQGNGCMGEGGKPTYALYIETVVVPGFLVDVSNFLNREFCSRLLWMCLCM